MDRKVETSLFKILDTLYWIRDEQGTTGWGIREHLADMLGAPPTKEEIEAYLDHRSREAGELTTREALEEYKDTQDGIDEIWLETRYMELPIAEFLVFWDENGNRRDDKFVAIAPPVWNVTPEKYR